MEREDAAGRTGELVAGRYRLLEVAGRGGQSVVYRATDERAGDYVAIKVLLDRVAADSEWRERMFREARAMATLTGTNAVRVLDQCWTDDGALCLVMEFLHGQDLHDVLTRVERDGRRLPPDWLDFIFEPIVQTLELAHEHGIVHRDLKPENIYVLADSHGGGVRLLDFGFAKFTRLPGFTASGTVAGSPSYIAPEAWRGAPEKLSESVDVYGLSAVLFRCLAGRPPFASENIIHLLQAVTTAPRPSLRALRPDLPAGADDWARMALAIEPGDRFRSVRGSWNALRSVLGLPVAW